ncbi:MAG: UDP-N-acetylglucosamine 2-epimerase (non-hydrolyzing), partial [Dolichospermum sp.]
MTNQHRIGIILGTRPEAIKLAPVIQVFQNSPDFELQVILTGQHREMVEQVMKLFKLKADWNLEIMQRQQSLS